MKKLLLVILSLFLYVPCEAATRYKIILSTRDITINSGNVGIGTSVPSNKFSVIGSVDLSSLTVYGTITSTSGFIVRNSTITGNLYTTGKIVKRYTNVADAATISPNCDTTDIVRQANTQPTGTLTVDNPTGSLSEGQSLLFRIKSTNVQTFSWGANYRGGTTALPTATTGSDKVDYYAFIYNAVDGKWDFTGTATGF